MLEQHGKQVTGGDHPQGTILEVAADGETRRYQLTTDLDPRARRKLESLAQRHLEQPNASLRVLTPNVAQTVDRAARSSDGWTFDGDAPRFIDSINQHTVEYVEDGLSRDVLHRRVQELNPRYADVWRLVTATALESWKLGDSQPEPVWLDIEDLLTAMGFERHHKGGFRAEHVHAAAEAMNALCNMWIVVPLGAKIFPQDPATKRRKPRVLVTERRAAVLVKMQVDNLRDLFGTISIPMRWQVQPGQWIRDYPRQFAPYLKALVELNATGAVNVWCKAIGTELTYLYADGGANADAAITVRHLLERAGVYREVERWSEQRNNARAREYFERALDTLQELRLFASWCYEESDHALLEATKRADRFARWLETRLRFTVNPQVLARVPDVPPTD